MHLIKLCLGTLALVTLQAIVLAAPALAQSGSRHTVRNPSAQKQSAPQSRPGACYTRPLIQGSGNVRICG